jgi:hypothetical protein
MGTFQDFQFWNKMKKQIEYFEHIYGKQFILKINRTPMKSFHFLCFFSLLFCLPSLGFSQSNPPTPTVHYSYDANGNRIQRWVTIDKIVKADTADSLHQDTAFKNKVNGADNKQGQRISLYPNPTQGLLDLQITGMKEGETAEYVFVSLTGQELLRKKTGSPQTRIDISNFAPGTYVVNVTLGGRVERWKVVKQ